MTDWPGDVAPLPHQVREDRLAARLAGMVGGDRYLTNDDAPLWEDA